MELIIKLNRLQNQYDSFKEQRTEVISDPKEIEKRILQFITNSNTTAIYACMDSSRPEVIIKDENLKELISNKKANGLNLKAISEITIENIHYCKDLMLIADELRHLDGIKGTFYLSNTEYIALAYLHGKRKHAEQIIYSNVKEIVDQQRYLFQTLWNKSLSAEQKLKEIEEGLMPSIVEIANDPFDIQEQILKMASSTKEELLGLFSTSDAFHRQELAGGISLAMKMAKEHNIKIRFLTPMDDKIKKLFDEIKKQNIDFEIKHIEKNFVSFALSDRKSSLIVELKDNTKNNTYEATGNMIYSNSQSTVLFYVSIFESFWQQAILYENTQNELEKTKDEMAEIKEYLECVLEEKSRMRY